MFETGFAARTPISIDQISHIVVDNGGQAALWCSGGAAVVGQPTHHTRLCRRCLAVLAEQDDADDVLAELGWP